MVNTPPANAGNVRDSGLIPGLGRSPGEGNGNPKLHLPGESHGEEPGGLQSLGLHRVRCNWSDLAYILILIEH